MGASQGAESKPQQAAAQSGKPLQDTVKLNVYSPTGGQHAVYHSGVEVLGAEYVFGGGDSSFSGVTAQRPRIPPPGSGWVFYQTVDIGPLQLARDAAHRALTELRSEFAASSYNLVSRNCNHFADALCNRLCGHGIPGWVNRLAGVGSAVQSAVGATQGSAGQRSEGGAGGPAAAGLVARFTTGGDLGSEVDWNNVGVLNSGLEDATGALRTGEEVASLSDGSPELLIIIPFISPVKLKAVQIEAPSRARAAVKARLFANQRDLDMDDAAGGVASTQEVTSIDWNEIQQGHSMVSASIEVNFLKFQNLGCLAVYLASEEDEATNHQKLCYHLPYIHANKA